MTQLISKNYFDEKFDEINVKLDLIILSLSSLNERVQKYENVIVIDDIDQQINILYPIIIKEEQ